MIEVVEDISWEYSMDAGLEKCIGKQVGIAFEFKMLDRGVISSRSVRNTFPFIDKH